MSYASGSEKLSFLDLRFGLAPLKMLEFTGQKSLTSKKHTADFCLTAKLRRAMARACPSTAPTPAVLATCWEALWPSAAPGQASTSLESAFTFGFTVGVHSCAERGVRDAQRSEP